MKDKMVLRKQMHRRKSHPRIMSAREMNTFMNCIERNKINMGKLS